MQQIPEGHVGWTKEIEYEPVFNLGNNMLESLSRLNQAERLCKKLPGLDCGSCGAPTCKALAEDIVRGEAREEDCVYYLRDNLHRLSQEITTLAQDLADDGTTGKTDSRENLKVLTEYIQRISDEILLLDTKMKSTEQEEP